LDYSTLGTDTVTIYVGPKRKKFLVHKKLICDRSEYFSKAFKGGFQETEKGVMYLPEDDIEAFDSFVNFIYRNTLPKFVKDEDPPTEDAIDEYGCEKLAPLFYLAEKYCMNELANKVMDAIQDHGLKYEVMPGEADMRTFYENTRHKSKLRLYGTLCVLYETLLQDGDYTEEYVRLANTFPDFAADYFMLHRKHRELLSIGNVADPRIRNDEEGFGKCYFHTHGKGEKCHLDEEE
jgi:hypothetical protein